MRPKKSETTGEGDLFRARLDQIINPKHELVQLAGRIDWAWIDQRSPLHSGNGRPGVETRFMIGLLLLPSTAFPMRRWRPLRLSQIKSEYFGDAARPGLEGEEYALPSEPCAIGAHPCPTIGACASHYSSSCKTAARDEDAARRIQQHGQGIPAGSNRSVVQHMRFAMASAATSVDHDRTLRIKTSP